MPESAMPEHANAGREFAGALKGTLMQGKRGLIMVWRTIARWPGALPPPVSRTGAELCSAIRGSAGQARGAACRERRLDLCGAV